MRTPFTGGKRVKCIELHLPNWFREFISRIRLLVKLWRYWHSSVCCSGILLWSFMYFSVQCITCKWHFVCCFVPQADAIVGKLQNIKEQEKDGKCTLVIAADTVSFHFRLEFIWYSLIKKHNLRELIMIDCLCLKDQPEVPN